MNKKEIVAKFECEHKKGQEEVRQKKQYEKEKRDWEVFHRKEVEWGASFTNQDYSYKNTKKYQYAIWYYYKRLQLLKVSLIPLFSVVVVGLLFLKRPSFNNYLMMGVFVGLSRGIGTNGFDNEGQLTFSHLASGYEFFRLSEWERTKKRLKAFFFGLLFPPILFIWHMYDFLEVLINQDSPIPLKSSSGISGPHEEIVGRIDKDGNIYKRDF